MNKTIVELKQERASAIEDMNTILNTVKEEKREKNEDESKRFSALDESIVALDAKIAEAERMESLNKSIVKNKPMKEEDKVARKYDLSKAIREAGKLTGLEAEMHQEAERELAGMSLRGNLYIPEMLIKRANEETKTTGLAAGHIPIDNTSLDLVVPKPLHAELGVTQISLTNGKVDVPFSKGHAAAEVSEAGSASQSVPTDTKGTLTATRHQGWQKFTQEYLSESSLMGSVLSDMVAALDRSLTKKILGDATDANVQVAAAGTAVALTYATTLDLIEALISDGLSDKQAFVMNSGVFFKLAQTEKASSTAQFIIDIFNAGGLKGGISGVAAHGTSLMVADTTYTDNYPIVFGDWSKAYAATWGGVQLLVDPYSASTTGYTTITFMRMQDAVANPYAFASNKKVAI